MKQSKSPQPSRARGFSAVEAVLIILVVVALGAGGWYLWHRNHKPAGTQKDGPAATQHQQTKQTVDPYAGWKTYEDSGYQLASGISVKYPFDWTVGVGNSKAFAWEIVPPSSATASINARVVYLDASKTPQQEWDNCANPDACGPAEGDTKLTESAAPINGLDAYSVKMRGSTDTYYATVIKGTKVTSHGVPFVELIVYSPDDATLDVYHKITASATFN